MDLHKKKLNNTMDKNNQYTNMQRNYYDSTAHIMEIENHRKHNSNPDYYGLLLKEISDNPENWKNKVALDFGCGCGRNVKNLVELAPFNHADGCDISKENIEKTRQFLHNSNIEKNIYNLYTTTGISLDPIESNKYDFVMSTIVLQHICVHSIRLNLLKDIYRVMKDNGLFSFQMAQYNRQGETNATYYFDDNWNAPGTNGMKDVSIDDPNDLIKELSEIGYKNISYVIRPDWDYNNEKYFENGNKWIFVKCYK